MNRILILVALGAIGAGAYVFFTQGEQPSEVQQTSTVTPAEPVTEAPVQATTEEVATAADEAVDQAAAAVTETLSQAGEAASEAVQDATDSVAQAVDQASEATSDVAAQATETASSAADTATEAANSAVDTATEVANDAATAVGEQVAAAQTGAAELYKSWQDNGLLTESGFDYDKMVENVETSALNETLKTGVLKVLSGIKAAPETISVQAQALRALMAN
ncbi:hypothetical protein KBY23_01760 [Ruegeria pomeroyi]|nr:hypothetical protein [Ruegeria pomeroyi]MCE8527858.1 hypothetical protein [Ruegeria pomeroyi]